MNLTRPLVVGVVAGGQFAAALISRLWAGRLSDSRGAKYAVVLGPVSVQITRPKTDRATC